MLKHIQHKDKQTINILWTKKNYSNLVVSAIYASGHVEIPFESF